jgi:hypothetical protein
VVLGGVVVDVVVGGVVTPSVVLDGPVLTRFLPTQVLAGRRSCKPLLRPTQSAHDCARVLAWLDNVTRRHVACVPQLQINSYPRNWWPGRFRLHVPGSSSIKARYLYLAFHASRWLGFL